MYIQYMFIYINNKNLLKSCRKSMSRPAQALDAAAGWAVCAAVVSDSRVQSSPRDSSEPGPLGSIQSLTWNNKPWGQPPSPPVPPHLTGAQRWRGSTRLPGEKHASITDQSPSWKLPNPSLFPPLFLCFAFPISFLSFSLLLPLSLSSRSLISFLLPLISLSGISHLFFDISHISPRSLYLSLSTLCFLFCQLCSIHLYLKWQQLEVCWFWVLSQTPLATWTKYCCNMSPAACYVLYNANLIFLVVWIWLHEIMSQGVCERKF